MSKSSSQLIRTIPLEDNELTALLDRLDSLAEEDPRNKSGRHGQRFTLRLTHCVVHLQQPGDPSSVAYIVATRQISEGGISFLHGGFVHAGTKVVIQLISTHGSWVDVEGEVVHCRYIERRVHEIGVRFNRKVRPGDYTTAANRYRVLLVEDEEAMAKLATFHLTQLNADVDRAKNGEEAIEMALKSAYDIILTDIQMPVMDGYEEVAELRRQGYTGIIVAATALTTDRDKQKCLDSGCNMYIKKPYVREDLAKLLEATKAEALCSTFQSNTAMRPLIAEFVRTMPNKLKTITNAFREEDLETLLAAARSLKAEGGSYGYDSITEAAEQLERAIVESGSPERLRTLVAELTRLCTLAHATIGDYADEEAELADA